MGDVGADGLDALAGLARGISSQGFGNVFYGSVRDTDVFRSSDTILMSESLRLVGTDSTNAMGDPLGTVIAAGFFDPAGTLTNLQQMILKI